MCGLCGEISFAGHADAGAVARMAAAMQARGPDAGGLFAHDGLAAGHRRLAILDLAPSSQQPMLDPELGLGIVFNGCIYNFRELRQELKDKGRRFFSAGDTEVILKAYAEWGPDCVSRFHGMFAFALWERDSGLVMLARDRLGIKPLYYAETTGRFRFASTLPALLANPDVDRSIDPAALHHYMSWHALVPPPLTPLRGVRKLPPATVLLIRPDGGREERVYWRLQVGARTEDEAVTEEEWRGALRAALGRAVERRTVADVPVGVLLSGGLDSSLLVGLLARQGRGDLKTFSIGFESVGGVAGDEFAYSDIVARTFATEHTRIRVPAERMAPALPRVIAAMSEPMMSHDAIGFYLLSQEVARHVRVVQSGQGADEVFAGYHWHGRMAGSNDAVSDYARLYFDRDHAGMADALEPDFLGPDVSRAFVERRFAAMGAAPAIDKVLQIDQEIMMVDDPVKRVDNMTMAWGLEARVPFLDHEVVELAARMPAAIKVADGGKGIMKKAARGVVPDAVIDRPKGYFPVPALKYLRGPVLDFVRDTLGAQAARQRGVFRRAYVDRLLANPEGELTPKRHSKLWQLAVFEAWLQARAI